MPRSLTSAGGCQLVADPVGLQRDTHDVGTNALSYDGDRQRRSAAASDAQEDDAVGTQSAAPSMPLRARVFIAHHPAIRTVVVAPQIARLRKKSTTLMATIDVRTALPTATPTPAGPPLAV